ncbi:MAG TPA: hypothetical protein VGK84_12740 [Candidatus Tumulicola sp.]
MESTIAIDIALEPDATMLRHAQADNARLRGAFPNGFGLDATHHPHVSVLQRYVLVKDLGSIYNAAGAVMVKANPLPWKLTALKYYYLPGGPIGLAGIVVRPTNELLALQQALIEAVAPFTVETGTGAAFFTTPEEPDINQPTIDYVAAFVPHATGAHFNPHVTIGVGPVAYLDKILAEPFDDFTFSPAGASVYQLGDYGTARKALKMLELQP